MAVSMYSLKGWQVLLANWSVQWKEYKRDGVLSHVVTDALDHDFLVDPYTLLMG